MTDLEAVADSETCSDPDGEIRHLKSTIAALRQALEDGEAERNALRQRVRAAYEGDIAELKATITALRDALEESRHSGRMAAESVVANSAGEIAQLRQIAQALRDIGGIIRKRLGGVTRFPTAEAVLQRLRQIPMIQRCKRLDAVRQ